MGRDVTSGQLISRIGDGDVPGPEEDDCKGNVPLLAAVSKKEISYLGEVSTIWLLLPLSRTVQKACPVPDRHTVSAGV